jgi:hypothetical protein
MTVLRSGAGVEFEQGGAVEVSATARLNGGSRIYCHVYADSAPILSVVDEHVRMSVSVPDPDQVTADDVTWGRQLADAVARYMAELEKRAATDGTAALDEPSGRAA